MMDRNEAYRILEIRPPFTERVLKSAFRAKILIAHPDRGGTNEKFRAVKSAFDILIGDANMDLEVDPVTKRVIDRTVEGVLLETLGKGLRVSATKCLGCKGHGYQSETRFKDCASCGGWSESRDFYTLMQNMAARMNCKVCKGTGRGASEAVRYWVCVGCEGTGEIASFNPVFIKNSMSVNQMRQEMRDQIREHARGAQDAGARARAQQAEQFRGKQDDWAKIYDQLKKKL